VAVGHALGKTLRFVPLPVPVARAALWTVGSVARMFGRASVLSSERAAEFLAPAWTCRSDALQADAGWHARIDLEPGLARTAAWYRQHGWLT
jgi:nucleoside-diphosphate-sugar epimerase